MPRPYTAMRFVYGFSGRFVGDAYMRPARFTRQVALPVWLQRAAYMPPLRVTRDFHIAVMSRVDPQPPPRFFVCAFGTNSTLFIIFYLLSFIFTSPLPQIFIYLFI